MWDNWVVGERQSEDQGGMGGGCDDVYELGGIYYGYVDLLVYEGGVMQGFVNGGVTVVGYGREKVVF